jgi:hypothetical protein
LDPSSLNVSAMEDEKKTLLLLLLLLLLGKV